MENEESAKTEILVYYGETALLNPLVALQIADFEESVKRIKEQEDALKSAILAEMERKGIIKLENDILTITYVAPTERESFDAKEFRQDCPDLYDEYVKFTHVKSSVRIKVK